MSPIHIVRKLQCINVLLKWTLFLAGPHIQAIQISCQLYSNVDIKDSLALQILQRANKNFKWPIKIWKFACTGTWMGLGPLAHHNFGLGLTLMEIIILNNFILGGISYMFGKVYPTVYLTKIHVYLPKWSFWILLSPNQGIFCPSLGPEFQPLSQSKIATFFPNIISDFYLFFVTFFRDHYYLWEIMTHISMILKRLCLNGMLGII